MNIDIQQQSYTRNEEIPNPVLRRSDHLSLYLRLPRHLKELRMDHNGSARGSGQLFNAAVPQRQFQNHRSEDDEGEEPVDADSTSACISDEAKADTVTFSETIMICESQTSNSSKEAEAGCSTTDLKSILKPSSYRTYRRRWTWGPPARAVRRNSNSSLEKRKSQLL